MEEGTHFQKVMADDGSRMRAIFFLISAAADMLRRYTRALVRRLVSERIFEEDVLGEHSRGGQQTRPDMCNGDRRQGHRERQG